MSELLFTAFSNRTDAVELARTVEKQLDAEGVASTIYLFDSDEPPPKLDEHALVVSLGGDGTFLRAARLAHAAGARVVAVNLGQVGFLLNVPPTEVTENIRGALEEVAVAQRLALQITVAGSDASEFALNEVVVERSRPGTMARVRTYVDNEEFLTYSADGVMVATPTGSTGYNFSAGGPVVEATLSLMILTPVAPHFTIDRSIVVPGEQTVKLVVIEKPAVLVADGQAIGTLEPGQSIEVRRNPTPVRVVATRSFDLATRLRRSLREGHA